MNFIFKLAVVLFLLGFVYTQSLNAVQLEYMARYPVGSNADGTVLWFDDVTGTYYNAGPMSTNRGSAGNQPGEATYRRPGETLGATSENTGGNTGGGTGDVGSNVDNRSAEELARLQWLADLESAKQQAQSLRNQGSNTFNTILDSVKNFRDRSGEQFRNAGQEIINTASGILGDNARLGQSARKQALNTARAQGLGDSSRLGLLNSVTSGLAGNQGQAIAKRGENERENQLQYQGRLDEANTRERQATDYKTAVEDQAGQVERLGIQNAGFNFAGLLDNLRQNIQALNSVGQLNPGTLNSYTSDFGGLTNNLNTVMSGLSNQVGQQGGVQPSNLSLSPFSNFQEQLKRLYSR